MPILKKNVKNDFTIVHNTFIRDEELGIDGRGLLLTMISMKDGWKFSVKGLSSILPDGEHKVGTTLKKLETLGYLQRRRITDKHGRVTEWEYDFSDEPIFRDQKKPHCGFADVDNSDVDNSDVENSIDNKILFNQESNNQVLSNKTYLINQSTEEIKDFNNFCENKAIDRIDMDRYTQYKELIYSNIDYALIAQDETERSQIDEIVENMLEMLCCTAPVIKISGNEISTNIVRNRLLKIDSSHIEYILLCLKHNTTKVRNIKAYLRAVIYNAPSTMDNYYNAEVNNALSAPKLE